MKWVDNDWPNVDVVGCRISDGLESLLKGVVDDAERRKDRVYRRQDHDQLVENVVQGYSANKKKIYRYAIR